jgi:hypothetical protein
MRQERDVSGVEPPGVLLVNLEQNGAGGDGVEPEVPGIGCSVMPQGALSSERQ